MPDRTPFRSLVLWMGTKREHFMCVHLKGLLYSIKRSKPRQCLLRAFHVCTFKGVTLLYQKRLNTSMFTESISCVYFQSCSSTLSNKRTTSMFTESTSTKELTIIMHHSASHVFAFNDNVRGYFQLLMPYMFNLFCKSNSFIIYK